MRSVLANLIPPTPDGWQYIFRDDLGDGRALLGYAETWTSPHAPDGAWKHSPQPSSFHGVVRFEHVCDRGGRGVVICAPKLRIDEGHTLTCPIGGRTTVRPSILCPDCGTHGFVTDGVWEPC